MRWKVMTPAQRGAYWQLICWQMQSDDGMLTDNVQRLSALADIDLTHKHNAIVLDAFPLHSEENKRANCRALQEWKKREQLSQTRSKAGGKGAAKRWQTHGKRMAIAPTTTTTITYTARSTDKKISTDTAKTPLSAQLVFDGVKITGVSEDMLAAWKEAYPAVDLKTEIHRAAQWLIANPAKRKKNIYRFLINWFGRNQERGGNVASVNPRPRANI